MGCVCPLSNHIPLSCSPLGQVFLLPLSCSLSLLSHPLPPAFVSYSLPFVSLGQMNLLCAKNLFLGCPTPILTPTSPTVQDLESPSRQPSEHVCEGGSTLGDWHQKMHLVDLVDDTVPQAGGVQNWIERRGRHRPSSLSASWLNVMWPVATLFPSTTDYAGMVKQKKSLLP